MADGLSSKGVKFCMRTWFTKSNETSRLNWLGLLLSLPVICISSSCTKTTEQGVTSPTSSSTPMPQNQGNSSTSNSLQSTSKEPHATETSAKSIIRFEDITESSGINHTITSGYEAELYSMLEFVGGGVAVIDFDLDGLCDLMFAGGGYFPSQTSIAGRTGAVYRARDCFQFSDQTTATKFDSSKFYNHGIFIDDFDADGFDDALVTGFGGLQLFLNAGDGTFALATDAQTPHDPNWSTAACTGDVNNDGLVDLYVAHYGNWSLENNPPCFSERSTSRGRVACSPESFPGIDDMFFVLQPNGEFWDQSKQVGLAPQGRGLGIVSADLEGDGDIDFYVANDEYENFLYLNDGHGRLMESGIQSGCAADQNGTAQGSMGVAIGDYQGDGKADLFVTNFTKELCALYAQRSRAGFRFVSQQAGIQLLGPAQVSWGTVFHDLDLDGDEDLMVVSGHVDRNSDYQRQAPTILENVQSRFIETTKSAGTYFEQMWPARALGLMDHDFDGNMDCVVTHLDEPSHVLRNVTKAEGSYVHVQLIGTRSNRNAIGAIMKLSMPENQVQLRHRYGGGSYLTSA